MTVEVTTLNLTPQEIEILILESAIEASKKYEEGKYRKVIFAVREWEKTKDDLDKLNRLIADKRDHYLREVV